MYFWTKHVFCHKTHEHQKTHDVSFWCLYIFRQNTWFEENIWDMFLLVMCIETKHVTCANTYAVLFSNHVFCPKTHKHQKHAWHVNLVFMCSRTKHMTSKNTCNMCKKKYMPHVFIGFMCVEVKHINTKITCHVGKVFMCFAMEHVNTKKTCYMSKWCFCVFAKHVR